MMEYTYDLPKDATPEEYRAALGKIRNALRDGIRNAPNQTTREYIRDIWDDFHTIAGHFIRLEEVVKSGQKMKKNK